MDKILSARVDESVISQIGALARKLGTTKKAIIEKAIRLYAEKMGKEDGFDVLKETLGAWQRKESPGETVKKARKAFRSSMERHRK